MLLCCDEAPAWQQLLSWGLSSELYRYIPRYNSGGGFHAEVPHRPLFDTVHSIEEEPLGFFL